MRRGGEEGSRDNTSKTAFYTPFAGHLTNNNNYNGGRKRGGGEEGAKCYKRYKTPFWCGWLRGFGEVAVRTDILSPAWVAKYRTPGRGGS